MSKNTANRTVGGHIKEGFKNIKTTYDTLYNRKGGGGMGGGKKTAATNVKLITTGKARSGAPKISGAQRATLATMGAASVTPIGPIAAFALGVKKSVQQKATAKARLNPTPTTTTPKKGKVISLTTKKK